jgi:hypothetical protein
VLFCDAKRKLSMSDRNSTISIPAILCAQQDGRPVKLGSPQEIVDAYAQLQPNDKTNHYVMYRGRSYRGRNVLKVLMER